MNRCLESYIYIYNGAKLEPLSIVFFRRSVLLEAFCIIRSVCVCTHRNRPLNYCWCQIFSWAKTQLLMINQLQDFLPRKSLSPPVRSWQRPSMQLWASTASNYCWRSDFGDALDVPKEALFNINSASICTSAYMKHTWPCWGNCRWCMCMV